MLLGLHTQECENCRRCNPRTFSVEGAQSHECAGHSGFSVPPGASRKDMVDSPLCNIPRFTIGVSRLLDTHREVRSRQQYRTQLSESGSMMEPHRSLPYAVVGSFIPFPLPPQAAQAGLLVDSEVGTFASRIYPLTSVNLEFREAHMREKFPYLVLCLFFGASCTTRIDYEVHFKATANYMGRKNMRRLPKRRLE